MPLKRDVAVKEQTELEDLRLLRDILYKHPEILQKVEDSRTAQLHRENIEAQEQAQQDLEAYRRGEL